MWIRAHCRSKKEGAEALVVEKGLLQRTLQAYPAITKIHDKRDIGSSFVSQPNISWNNPFVHINLVILKGPCRFNAVSPFDGDRFEEFV